MRRTNLIVILASILLVACLATSALAEESALSALWNSGRDLLFDTDNVTVIGEATFSLDGVRFKTAMLHYEQEGYRSFYDLKLSTPRKDGEQETGWTIIADGEGLVYAMEYFEPGIYHPGSSAVCNTLLRRSVELDAITELCGLLLGQVEPLLPENAIMVSEGDGNTSVNITLAGDQLPDIAQSALNLGFSYLADRWFSYGYDRTYSEDERVPYENYVTVTSALTDGTVRWALKSVEADFDMDDQGRLVGGSGNLTVSSTFHDGTVRNVTVSFSFSASDWGTTQVKDFDPDEYGVSLPDWYYGDESLYMDYPSLTGEEWDAMFDKSVAILNAQGYEIPENCDWGGWTDWDGMCYIELDPSEEEAYCFDFSSEGDLWFMQNATADWLYSDETDVEGVEDDVISAAQALALSFLQEYNPGLAEKAEDLAPQTMMTDQDGGLFLSFYDAGSDALFVVRVEPSLRIEYFSAGGNG